MQNQQQIELDPADVINALTAKLTAANQREIMLEAALAKAHREIAALSQPQKVDPAE